MTTCIIGAGCSGFTTAKRLRDRGLPFDIYEKSDRIGGNWAYKNPNGMSACYQSLHIDTSKWRLAFEDYPVPGDWPEVRLADHQPLPLQDRECFAHRSRADTEPFGEGDQAQRLTALEHSGDDLVP